MADLEPCPFCGDESLQGTEKTGESIFAAVRADPPEGAR